MGLAFVTVVIAGLVQAAPAGAYELSGKRWPGNGIPF